MKRISFKPELALAIRERRKTETRRIITPQPDTYIDIDPFWNNGGYRMRVGATNLIAPRYLPGEIVGVCEPWYVSAQWDDFSGAQLVAMEEDGALIKQSIHYAADCTPLCSHGRARLARFLPDAFVRTKLRILDVNAERLNCITEEQAVAEGLAASGIARDHFASLWNTIHGDEAPWGTNPLVWRYQFQLV